MIVKKAKREQLIDMDKEADKPAEPATKEVVAEPVVADTVAMVQPYDEEPMRADTLRTTFRQLAPYQILRASLLMPFHKDGKVNPSIVDFYRGVLLAMEDIKNEGYDVELSVFDTEGSVEKIQSIMADEPLFFEAQLIIGPVYENELSVVLPYATENGIPVISPLADITSLHSPMLFQMQAENENKYDKFERVFDGSREVVIIHTPSVDAEYEAKMRELSAGHVVYELNYTFDRESLLYMRNADGTNGEQIDITEFMRSRTDKLFVVLASKETDVDRVLTTLSSTRASILGRGSLMGDYVVVGNRHWKQMTSIDKQTFFNNNTLFLVPYHANRGNSSVAVFDARYIEAYEALPTMYAYRGYDAAMIFCRKMFCGFEDDVNEVVMPLATPYTFTFKDGLYVNTCWTMERYKSNFTIEVE
ncbi:MAG: amino acid ABC transporter substrate-binding protein, partial [Alistipes sp.]|nr:amino acid ABC transporter substrate-binding protein [Alistipes sp.]